ncbi:hypothetical protein [Variovorax guangxiensis]|uniref:Uncharacterized protein n=1 Tax=Variovorax guangxiensis TaxID=1775474 RepID=A0A840G0Q0_9BURK|nr:hypothetical protein [Variovorax guangxiensis]MBB4224877.1 hypothetical protein [Variovorax guangxiensis]
MGGVEFALCPGSLPRLDYAFPLQLRLGKKLQPMPIYFFGAFLIVSLSQQAWISAPI